MSNCEPGLSVRNRSNWHTRWIFAKNLNWPSKSPVSNFSTPALWTGGGGDRRWFCVSGRWAGTPAQLHLHACPPLPQIVLRACAHPFTAYASGAARMCACSPITSAPRYWMALVLGIPWSKWCYMEKGWDLFSFLPESRIWNNVLEIKVRFWLNVVKPLSS